MLAILLLANVPALARERAVRAPASLPMFKSAMWIGAHPDDESVIAPLLAPLCRADDAKCSMIVLTRGEAGACLLPGGCQPDVATVRSAEAAAAAGYFHADLTLLALADGGGTLPPPWANDEALIARLALLIEAANPDAIFTFDPRHGTTCHPDHRATADLVLAAVLRLPHPPAIYLLETRVRPDAAALHFEPALQSRSLIRFDATATWQAIIDDMKRHPSQFDAAWLAAIDGVPASERAVWVGAAGAMMREDVPYAPNCLR